jgi:hypothetical protein
VSRLYLHGGPLWQPLRYAQIGGLMFSTIVTLLLVPTLYAFVVLGLRWIAWTPYESTLVSSDEHSREGASHLAEHPLMRD